MLKIERGILRTEIPLPIIPRIYEDWELKRFLGEDYRDRIREYLERTGKIPSNYPLDWLHHKDDRYVHDGSSANYLIDQYINDGRDLLMVSVIPPGKSTSSDHSHPGESDGKPAIVEIYGCPLGAFNLHADGLVIRMSVGSSQQDIYPGVMHRVTAEKNSWGVVAILMKNAGFYERSQLHIRATK